MTVVYDLKNESSEWFHHVNSTISEECSEYFVEHCAIGSNEWWQLYENNKVVKETQRGNIVFIGERADLLGHTMKVVELNCNGKIVELEILENWQVSSLAIGALLEIEIFSVNFMGKYGPYKFQFEKRIEIIKT